MIVQRRTEESGQFVQYRRENAGPPTIYKQFLRDEEFIDVKLASKYEPNLILKGHRIVLASSSKFLHQKFKKNPNPRDVILVEVVEHKHLNYFIHLLYEGEITIPEPDLDGFQATLRALDVCFDSNEGERKTENNAGDITREEQVSSSSLANYSPKPNTPSKTSRSSSLEPNESAIEGTNSPVALHSSTPNISNLPPPLHTAPPPVATPAHVASSVPSDVKPDMKIFNAKVMNEDFMSRVQGGSKRLFIEEFPDAIPQGGTQAGPSSGNGGNNGSSLPKKPRVIETPRLPAISRSELGKPVIGPMGLFWVEQNNPKKKTKEELCQVNRNINFKQILVTDDRSKAYLGFETDKHAKNYVDNATLTNPDISTHPKVISNLPLQNLKPPSPPIERKVLIENVPLDWPGAQSIHRMLKKNKIEYKDVRFEIQKRHALVILFDQQNVDRTLMIVHRVGLNMSASIV